MICKCRETIPRRVVISSAWLSVTYKCQMVGSTNNNGFKVFFIFSYKHNEPIEEDKNGCGPLDLKMYEKTGILNQDTLCSNQSLSTAAPRNNNKPFT